MKNKISYGDADIDKDLENPTMVNINFSLDIKIKESLKKEAAEKGIGYQQLIGRVLKSHVEGLSLDDIMRELENHVSRSS